MLLGDKIKDQRTKKNMTQEALAEAVGVSRQTIARWESNKTKPSYSELTVIAHILEIDFDYFIDTKEQKPKKRNNTWLIRILIALTVFTLIQIKVLKNRIEALEIEVSKILAVPPTNPYVNPRTQEDWPFYMDEITHSIIAEESILTVDVMPKIETADQKIYAYVNDTIVEMEKNGQQIYEATIKLDINEPTIMIGAIIETKEQKRSIPLTTYDGYDEIRNTYAIPETTFINTLEDEISFSFSFFGGLQDGNYIKWSTEDNRRFVEAIGYNRNNQKILINKILFSIENEKGKYFQTELMESESLKNEYFDILVPTADIVEGTYDVVMEISDSSPLKYKIVYGELINNKNHVEYKAYEKPKINFDKN